VQLAREAVAFDPEFVLAWDALATSLDILAHQVDEVQAERLRAEVEQIRGQIAQLAPEHWSVNRERAYELWREGERAEAIEVARRIMQSGPLTYDHAYPYMSLIFAAGHLDETVALGEQLRAIEPLAMFLSRDQQWNYITARRFDEAEAEYRRSLTLDGSFSTPNYAAFLRTLAQNDSDLEALRALYRQVLEDFPDPDPLFLIDFGAVLHDRDAMLAILHRAAADYSYRGERNLLFLADALGGANLAAAWMRESMESIKGFKEGHMAAEMYWTLWMAPYSALRSHPEFKKLLIETGVAEYWRQTGKWGDGCKPVGSDDFQCQ
jgi:tetratricopeptide (TPR) repeat protein